MDYTKAGDYELNRITSERTGRSRVNPYCGDLSLAFSLIIGHRFRVNAKVGGFRVALVVEGGRHFGYEDTHLARAIVIAWNKWQDEKTKPTNG